MPVPVSRKQPHGKLPPQIKLAQLSSAKLFQKRRFVKCTIFCLDNTICYAQNLSVETNPTSI